MRTHKHTARKISFSAFFRFRRKSGKEMDFKEAGCKNKIFSPSQDRASGVPFAFDIE